MDPTRAMDGGDDAARRDGAWDAVLRALRRVVPYVDVEELDRAAPIREDAELDPQAFTRFIAAIADETGVTVPERDHALVTTLDDLVAYVLAHPAAA